MVPLAGCGGVAAAAVVWVLLVTEALPPGVAVATPVVFCALVELLPDQRPASFLPTPFCLVVVAVVDDDSLVPVVGCEGVVVVAGAVPLLAALPRDATEELVGEDEWALLLLL